MIVMLGFLKSWNVFSDPWIFFTIYNLFCVMLLFFL